MSFFQVHIILVLWWWWGGWVHIRQQYHLQGSPLQGSSETDPSCSWSRNVSCCVVVYTLPSLLLVSILSQKNLVHALPDVIFNTHFSIILSSRPTSSKCGVQIAKLLIMQSRPVSCYFLPLRLSFSARC